MNHAVEPDTSGVRLLHDMKIVEVHADSSACGGAMAAAIAGLLLADLGASRVRVSSGELPLEAMLKIGPAWTRGVRSHEVPGLDRQALEAWVVDADVVLVAGPRDAVEAVGVDPGWLASINPAAVWCRIAPDESPAAFGQDFDLLVQAEVGTLSRGRQFRPAFCGAPIAAYSAALAAAAGVALSLFQRARLGEAAAVETSLRAALIASQVLRGARPREASRSVLDEWMSDRATESIFECADGAELYLNGNGRGAFDTLIQLVGDEPSSHGYTHEFGTGQLSERMRSWRPAFKTRPRNVWLEDLQRHAVIAAPVLQLGEALYADHVVQSGLSLLAEGPSGDEHVLGPVIVNRRIGPDDSSRRTEDNWSDDSLMAVHHNSARPLAGLRVLDFGQYIAGPYASTILADMGADVIKVEAPSGDPMRFSKRPFLVAHRGKRSLCVDLKSAASRDVVEKLIAGADVVIHNFRDGVAERLGVGADTAMELNPRLVYVHASAFGSGGTWTKNGAFDFAVQSIIGTVVAAGDEEATRFLRWNPIDVSAAWLAAIAALVGLARVATHGSGSAQETSLLGAGPMPLSLF